MAEETKKTVESAIAIDSLDKNIAALIEMTAQLQKRLEKFMVPASTQSASNTGAIKDVEKNTMSQFTRLVFGFNNRVIEIQKNLESVLERLDI